MYQILLSSMLYTINYIVRISSITNDNLCLRLFVVLQALVVASEVMVGDTCIPSLIVINNTINQLETNIF